jgi:hypothetical protein
VADDHAAPEAAGFDAPDYDRNPRSSICRRLTAGHVPGMRAVQPGLPCPFKTPAVWVVAPAGAASSVFLMFSLPVETWERLGLRLVIGLAFYFLYGVRHSRLAAPPP